MGNWSIEARSLSIVGGVASHNFWVLRDDNGNAVAELHGLATDRQTGRTVPIGTDADRHSLRAVHLIHDADYARNFGSRQAGTTFIQDGQRSETVVSASREEILERWKVGARTAANLINAQDLDYPPGGFRLDGNTRNSNSVYNTVGTMMVGGSNVPVFQGPLQPGVNNHVLDGTTIRLLQYDREQFRQGRDPGADVRVAAVDPGNPSPANAPTALVPGNDNLNRQFAQALQGTNGDRDAAATAIETLRNAPGYRADQDVAVVQGRNGQLIATQGQGDAAINVAVPKANPGDFERVANQLAQTPQSTQNVASQPDQPERARAM